MYSDNAKNLMLDELAAVATHASLHDGAPSTTGANEVSGGDPAYARQALTWGSAAGGEVAITNEPEFDVPASTSVLHVGFWSADEGGTFYGSAPVTQEDFGAQGTYKLVAAALDLNNDPE